MKKGKFATLATTALMVAALAPTAVQAEATGNYSYQTGGSNTAGNSYSHSSSYGNTGSSSAYANPNYGTSGGLYSNRNDGNSSHSSDNSDWNTHYNRGENVEWNANHRYGKDASATRSYGTSIERDTDTYHTGGRATHDDKMNLP